MAGFISAVHSIIVTGKLSDRYGTPVVVYYPGRLTLYVHRAVDGVIDPLPTHSFTPAGTADLTLSTAVELMARWLEDHPTGTRRPTRLSSCR